MASGITANCEFNLSGLTPFLRPYRAQIGLAIAVLVLAAAHPLVQPVALN